MQLSAREIELEKVKSETKVEEGLNTSLFNHGPFYAKGLLLMQSGMRGFGRSIYPRCSREKRSKFTLGCRPSMQ